MLVQARFVVGPPRVLNPDTPGVDFEPAISNLYGLLEDEQKTFPDQFLSVDVEVSLLGHVFCTDVLTLWSETEKCKSDLRSMHW